jgi:hypothetical protein
VIKVEIQQIFDRDPKQMLNPEEDFGPGGEGAVIRRSGTVSREA